jgi:high-affinity iron transporter
MLINTVILFLRDALPIIIIAVLLMSLSAQSPNKENDQNQWLMGGFALGVIATLLLINSIGFIAQSFDSTGAERMFAVLYCLIYLGILVHIWLTCFKGAVAKASIARGLTALVIMVLVLALNGSNFLVYITGYWSQSGAVRPLLIGVILGLGICVSIGILLYFVIAFSAQNISTNTSVVLIILYAAGQLMQASRLLLQIDAFVGGELGGELLWDTNLVIKESSELGHFLTALFGYDATPTLSQLIMYLVVLVVPLVLFMQAKKRALLGANPGANPKKGEVCS